MSDSSLPRPDSATPALRLFREASLGSSGLSAAMTLHQLYHAHFRPVVLIPTGAAQRHLQAVDESIDYWVQFTGDPPLQAIDDVTCAAFLTGLASLPGRRRRIRATGKLRIDQISPNTIRKHCGHVQRVMDRYGPKTRECRNAKALLDAVPFIEKPREREKDADDNFTLGEISLILEHCEAAVAPAWLARTQRRLWWQNLFYFDYNTGLRIGSIVLLCYDNVYNSEEGWWGKVRVKRDNVRKFAINQWALSAVERMKAITGPGTSGGDGEHIWHWPHDSSWLQENRRRILRASGLPEHRQFGFHGLRKANITEASEFDLLGASLQAGHKDVKTTVTSYVNPRRMAAAMDRLPQPKGKDGQQLKLF